MINHVVVFKFKKQFSDADIHTALSQLAALQKIIPGMSHFSCGANCSLEQLNKGFTHAFMMQFVDIQSRDEYINHPEHKQIADGVIVPMLENALDSVVVIDYESNDCLS
ncbi:MAG: Dabb family protein [Legionella sp.]